MRSELFKVLRDGRSCHGGSLTWPLPSQNEDGSWTPGEWVEVSGPLSMCSNGLHLTTNPREWYVEAAQVYAAEYDGEIVRDDGSDKVCVRRARLLSEVAWSDHGVYHEGHHDLYGNAQATLYGNAQARLYGNAQATLYGNAQARLYDNAQATLYGNAQATLSGNAQATLSGNAQATLSGNAQATLYGNAQATLYGNAQARLYDNAQARLYDNAQATLYGNAQARLYGNAQATLYGNAQATLYGNAQATSDRWHSPSATVALAQLAAHIDRRGGKLILRSAETEGTDGRTH
jgi:phage gp45-like